MFDCVYLACGDFESGSLGYGAVHVRKESEQFQCLDTVDGPWEFLLDFSSL